MSGSLTDQLNLHCEGPDSGSGRWFRSRVAQDLLYKQDGSPAGAGHTPDDGHPASPWPERDLKRTACEHLRRPLLPTKMVFQGSGRSPELGLLIPLIQSVPQMSPKRERGRKQSAYQKVPKDVGLKVTSTGVKKRSRMTGTLGRGCWGVAQTQACHPGSTQPGGTATDAGSRPTSC